MICPNCNAQLDGNYSECPYCRAPLQVNAILGIVMSFVAALCCCCAPLGMVGLLFAAKASVYNEHGNIDEAKKNLNIAMIFSCIGIAIGVIGEIITLIIWGSPILLYLVALLGLENQ